MTILNVEFFKSLPDICVVYSNYVGLPLKFFDNILLSFLFTADIFWVSLFSNKKYLLLTFFYTKTFVLLLWRAKSKNVQLVTVWDICSRIFEFLRWEAKNFVCLKTFAFCVKKRDACLKHLTFHRERQRDIYLKDSSS